MDARRRCTTVDRGFGDEEGEKAVNVRITGQEEGKTRARSGKG